MGKARRILGWTAASAATLFAIASATVYGLSEHVLATTYAPSDRFAAKGGNAEEGKRLARVLGCEDCHSHDLTGKVMFSEQRVGTLHAPNLTLIVPKMSDSQFAAALTDGIRPDGTGLYIVPSSRLRLLEDSEIVDLLAYLRTVPPRGPDRPGLALGPLGRIGIAFGKLRNEPRTIAEDGQLRAAAVKGTNRAAAWRRRPARNVTAPIWAAAAAH